MTSRTLDVMPGFAVALALSAAAANLPGSTVTIDNFSFSTPHLTVVRGTVVTWINRDDIPHTVASADAARTLHSPLLDTDERFSHRFDQAGRFAYFCSLHPHMQGVIVVR
nr:cupredoxin family copper-binding protein [uncultured Lichenicoccus sp.]